MRLRGGNISRTTMVSNHTGFKAVVAFLAVKPAGLSGF
jgi:hypothetical protein